MDMIKKIHNTLFGNDIKNYYINIASAVILLCLAFAFLLPIRVEAVSGVRIGSFLSESTITSDQFDAVILKDDVLLGEAAINKIIGISTDKAYNYNGVKKSITITHEKEKTINFILGSPDVEVNIDANSISAASSVIERLSNESIPKLIDGKPYVPASVVFKHLMDDAWYYYSYKSNVLWYGIYTSQKIFLQDFPYSVDGYQGIDSEYGDYEYNNIVFHDDKNNYGVVNYKFRSLSYDQDSRDGKDDSYYKNLYRGYNIIVPAEYSKITCTAAKDGCKFFTLERNNKIKLYDIRSMTISDEFDSVSYIKGKGVKLSTDEEAVMAKNFKIVYNHTPNPGMIDMQPRDKTPKTYDVDSINEAYIVKKNGKYGIYSSYLKSEIVYDKIESKNGIREVKDGDSENLGYIFFHKGENVYVYDGENIVDFSSLKSQEYNSLLFCVAIIVVVFMAILFVGIFVFRFITKRVYRTKEVTDKRRNDSSWG